MDCLEQSDIQPCKKSKGFNEEQFFERNVSDNNNVDSSSNYSSLLVNPSYKSIVWEDGDSTSNSEEMIESSKVSSYISKINTKNGFSELINQAGLVSENYSLVLLITTNYFSLFLTNL